MVNFIEVFDAVSSNVKFFQVEARTNVFKCVDAVDRQREHLERGHLANYINVGEIVRAEV